MVSFSFMHTIWYLKNTPHRSKHILTVWFRVCRVHPPIFNAITHVFLLLSSFFYFRLAIVVQPCRCTSLSTYFGLIDSFKVFNCQKFTDYRKKIFSISLGNCISTSTFNLLSLRLIRNTHVVDFAKYGLFSELNLFSVFSSFNHWSSLPSQSIPLDHPPRSCSP